MLHTRILALCLGLGLLAGCENNDLAEPPANLGDFALGLNIVVADNVEMVPISRRATVEEWEAVMKKAVEARFGRHQGSKLYNIGISVDGYALAPPGIPVVAAPKSVLVITANIWDDAAQKKLNPEGKQFTLFESLSGESVIGTGITRNKAEQMEALSYNAVKAVELWLLQNPEWFGLPPIARASAAPGPTVMSGPGAALAPTTAPNPVNRPLPAAVPAQAPMAAPVN